MAALQTLMEMGFSENAVKKSLTVTGGGVEQAMEWLLAHSEDPGINDPPAEKGPAGAVGAVGGEIGAGGAHAVEGAECEAGAASVGAAESEPGAAADQEAQEEAKSIKCDDCGKLFKTSEEVEFHAVKSGHTNFSESTEEKKPLSEEEKSQKKKNLEEKIKLRRKEREENEAKEALEREKKRIQMGQQIAERKRMMQEVEMKRLAEERRKEKQEDKLARQKVKEQIEQDRKARRERDLGNQGATSSDPKPQPPPAAQPPPKKDYTQAKLQIRFPSGTPLVQEFKAKEPLSAVRLWISLNRPDGVPAEAPFNLSTTFPRKIFDEEDMDKPLEVLGLVPTAVLMVSK